MKMPKLAMGLVTALVAASSLVLWSCADEPPQPSDSDIEKALVKQLPSFTRDSGFSVEAKQKLGTNVVVWQTQVRATITVTTDMFALESENSEVTFVRPVKLSDESIEVFGKSSSTQYAGAWQTTVKLEGQPIETLGQPLSAFGPKKVIIRGSEDEKQYFADGDVPATDEADIAEVKSIDDYCKTVDAITEQREIPDMIFADLSGAGKGKWRSFASEKALEKGLKKANSYCIAYNWKNEGRIVASNLTFSSPTGDWAKDVYHYFREDGSLAYVLSHFGTFVGPYKFEQRQYFDRQGRLISKSEEYYDFGSDEPLKIKPGDDVTADTADLRDQIDYYMAVNKLPFVNLLPPDGK